MTELKAYACMEPYENTGAIIFAKSNIEARRISANEFHDDEIAGMSVKRAPWADKYGARHKVPISVMIDHGWHFECCWSGARIDSNIYQDGIEIWNLEKKEYEYDEICKGKEPIGFQESICFACQEYADLYYEQKQKREVFEEGQLKYYRGIVFKNFPDAVLMNGDKFGWREYINTEKVRGQDSWVVEGVTIPFSFPGMKHSASLELRREPYNHSSIGPMKPNFFCANGDVEEFNKWSAGQKEKKNGS